MAEQLRCAGVLEAVKVSRAGYPVRLPFDQFAAEFGVLATLQPGGITLQPGATTASGAKAGGQHGGDKARTECQRLLRASGMARKRVAFGKTKLFIAGPVYEELQLVRRALHAKYATSLQVLRL